MRRGDKPYWASHATPRQQNFPLHISFARHAGCAWLTPPTQRHQQHVSGLVAPWSLKTIAHRLQPNPHLLQCLQPPHLPRGPCSLVAACSTKHRRLCPHLAPTTPCLPQPPPHLLGPSALMPSLMLMTSPRKPYAAWHTKYLCCPPRVSTLATSRGWRSPRAT